MKILSSLILLATLASCSTSTTQLSDSGKNVRVYPNRRGLQCEVVGKVVGENKEGSVELARNHARNLAGEKGADGIVFDEEIQNGSNWKVHSTAFKYE